MKRSTLLLVMAVCLSLTSFALNSKPGGSAVIAPPPPPLSISCTSTLLDNFADGNFNNNPTWSGNTNRFEYQANAEGGPNANGSRVIRSNPGNNNSGTYYMSTPINTWHTNQEWAFWYGRRGTATSASQVVRFWLYADNANVNSNSVNGYFVEIGDGSGTQEIRIRRVEDGDVTSTVITSSSGINGSYADYGLAIRVVRNELGEWELFTSAWPSSGSGGGIGANANVLTSTTNSRGTGTDNTIIPNGTGYIAVSYIVPNLSAANGRMTEFDNIYFTPCNPKTEVSLASAGTTVDETSGTVSITASITNPHPSVNTTAQLVLTSGDGTLINNYTTQTFTFPAGSGADRTVTVTITDDELCSGISSTLGFTLQNVSGGYSAIAGSSTAYSLTIEDDEALFANILEEDFETGDASDWWTPIAGSFNVSGSNPINGDYSIRHVNLGPNSGSTSTSTLLNGASIAGATTTWRFNMRNFNNEPNTSNYWIVCLTNDKANIAQQTINGYAVGIRPSTSFNQDYITLYRTEDDYLYPLVTSPIDVGTSHDKIGIEVIRDASGMWTLYVDTNGDFDNLVSQGSAMNTYWDHLGYFGAFFVWNSSSNTEFSLDDIHITQEACEQTLYSQTTGTSTGAIWSQLQVGTPVTATSGPFTTLVVQNGHNVTFAGNTLCRNLEINNGGTFTGGSSVVSILGDFTNNGTFTGGASTLRFNGSAAQTISGGGSTTFFDVVVNNSSGVSLDAPANIHGQLRANRGTFNTNNQLTLISNLNGTGSIGTINPQADVIGEITLQRFIPTAPQYWVYMCNPLLNQTLQHWNDDMVTTGFPGSDYPNYNFNSIYHYEESQPGGRNVGWVGATNVTNEVDPKLGYIVYMNATAVNISTNGVFQKGNVNVPLSYTDIEPGTGYFNPDGWNLVANVYPCTVDWEALQAASTSWSGGNGTYYVYDATASNYRAYNAPSHSGTANRYIASGQGFFVQASGLNQSLQYNENVKATSSSAFQRSAEETPLVRFNLTRGSMDDEMVLTLQEGATFGFDELYDAIKWESPIANAPEMGFVAPDESKLTLQAIGQITEDMEIPVYVKMPQTGNYVFSISEVQNLPLGVCITVQDLVTGEIIPMEAGQTLTINNTAAYTGNRLIIRMTAPIQAAVTNASCFEGNDGSIVLNSAVSSWTVLAEDAFGNTYYPENGIINGLSAGDYLVMLENSEALCNAQTVGLTVTEPEAIGSNVESVADRCNSSSNGIIEIIVENADLYNYTVTNAAGEVVAQETMADPYKEISGLTHGMYSVNVFNDCYNEIYNVDLNDPYAVSLEINSITPEINMPVGETVYIQAEAVSTNAIEYEWTVNGFDGGDLPYLNFAVNVEGVYNIQCVASTEGCSSTAFTSAVVTQEAVVLGTDDLTSGDPYASVTRMGNSVIVGFHNAADSKAKIALYNAAGKLVMQVSGFVSAHQVRTIDITGLASGMYIVHVEQDNRILAKQQIIK